MHYCETHKINSALVKHFISIESGYQCMKQLLDSSDPDGVFAVEDFTALGAMQALKESGKRMPQDVCSIVILH